MIRALPVETTLPAPTTKGGKGKQRTINSRSNSVAGNVFRSNLPEIVHPEALAYQTVRYAICALIARASITVYIDPTGDRTKIARIICRTAAGTAADPPGRLPRRS